MSIELTHFRIDSSADNRTTVWIDVAGRPVNVLWESVFDDLELLFNEVGHSVPGNKPLVLRSGKPTGFAVGADLKRIAMIEFDAEIKAFLERGQRLYDRLSRLPMPTVALIEAACLGGGLELAMACRYRFLTDTPRIQLGMPETKLGLIPGWGGTQRLVRLVGIEKALEMLVKGDPVNVRTAIEIGLADASCRPEELEPCLNEFLSGLSSKPPRRFETESPKLKEPTENLAAIAAFVPTLGTLTPSQLAVVRAVEQGLRLSFQAGLDAERNQFFALLMSPDVRTALDRFTNRSSKA
jgi:3-hydroxyacyl-CoA dehydrogenase / enoyl-CoA hydratase / 3-hydroxybutyryl-CoA epimerase